MMNFIKLTLTEGRGFALIDRCAVCAVCEANDVTEVYCIGSATTCFMVEETVEEVIKMMSKN